MKSYIVFNEISSNEVIDADLIVCTFDFNDTVTSVKRTLQKGNVTKQRDIGNDFGAIYDEPLSFSFALIKDDKTEFTYTEIRKINNWLATEYNHKLALYSDEYDWDFYYNGKFEKVEKKRINGVRGVVCSFVNDSAFMYRDIYVSKTLSFNNSSKTNSMTIDYNGSFDSVYPTLLINDNNSGAEVKYTFCVKNDAFTITDDGEENSFYVKLNNKLEIDGKNCIIKSNDSSIYIGDVFEGDVDWLKLKNGENEISFTVTSPTSIPDNASVTVTILGTEKILGGVINEFN